MKQKATLLIILLLITYASFGQSIKLDSSKIDTSAVLNEFEIFYIDSIFFAPYELKNGEFHSFTNGFNFRKKKIAFFDCGKTTDNGYITKKEFFKKILPKYRGPHGLTILNENEKRETGYDAIITINCKMITEKQVIEKLKLKMLPLGSK